MRADRRDTPPRHAAAWVSQNASQYTSPAGFATVWGPWTYDSRAPACWGAALHSHILLGLGPRESGRPSVTGSAAACPGRVPVGVGDTPGRGESGDSLRPRRRGSPPPAAAAPLP